MLLRDTRVSLRLNHFALHLSMGKRYHYCCCYYYLSMFVWRIMVWKTYKCTLFMYVDSVRGVAVHTHTPFKQWTSINCFECFVYYNQINHLNWSILWKHQQVTNYTTKYFIAVNMLNKQTYVRTYVHSCTRIFPMRWRRYGCASFNLQNIEILNCRRDTGSKIVRTLLSADQFKRAGVLCRSRENVDMRIPLIAFIGHHAVRHILSTLILNLCAEYMKQMMKYAYCILYFVS